MDEIIGDIDIVIDLYNVFKSRYFMLRAKYDNQLNSSKIYASKESQSEYLYASNDLQSFIMLELHLLEYAFTYGIYSLNMYATRIKNNLTDNEKDPHFLKLLKDNVRSLVETTKEIKNLPVDSYDIYKSHVESFMIYSSVLNGINIPDAISLDTTNTKKKKDKLLKKIAKINLMTNVITFLVSDKFINYRTEGGRAALNIALKYRTPRTLQYYANKSNSR